MTLNLSFRRFLLFGVLWTTFSGVGLAGLGRWTSSGPEGATVLSLAVDPTDSAKVFAGTQAGGVFQSSDSGARWTFAGLEGLSVSAILADPTDGKKLYAAAGSSLFKTTDGGISWRNASQGLPQPPITDPSVPRVTAQVSALAIGLPAILYAGLTIRQSTNAFTNVGGGLFQSLDGGETWAPTGLANVGVKSVLIDPTEPKVLYAVVVSSGSYGTPNSIRKSTDGGASWAVLRDDVSYAPTMDITALMLDPRSSATLYAASFNIISALPRIEKSSDGGATWSLLGTTPGEARVTALLATPSRPSLFYAATAGGILESADAAATWSRVLDTPSRCLAIAPANSAVLYAGAADGVSTSFDAGVSWTVNKAGLIATSARELRVNPRSRNELYARSGLKIFQSGDGGGNWQLIEELPSDLFPGGFAVDWKNPSIQYLGTMNGGLCTGVSRTLDGGRFWAPTSLTIGCILRIAMDPQNPDTVYAVGQFGLWKSTDGAVSWVSSLAQPISAFTIAAASQANLYVGITNQGILVSRDGGATWNSAGPGPSNVQSLTVDPENPATVYAGGSAGSLFKSTDRGATWRQAGQGLNGVGGVTDLAIDPSKSTNIYAASAQGVFRSVDGGVTFSAFSIGLTNFSVSALLFDPAGLLHAATQGGGVFDYEFPPGRLTIAPARRPPASRALKPRI